MCWYCFLFFLFLSTSPLPSSLPFSLSLFKGPDTGANVCQPTRLSRWIQKIVKPRILAEIMDPMHRRSSRFRTDYKGQCRFHFPKRTGNLSCLTTVWSLPYWHICSGTNAVDYASPFALDNKRFFHYPQHVFFPPFDSRFDAHFWNSLRHSRRGYSLQTSNALDSFPSLVSRGAGNTYLRAPYDTLAFQQLTVNRTSGTHGPLHPAGPYIWKNRLLYTFVSFSTIRLVPTWS